jgi:PAS domain S-box-containing protein
MSHLARELAGLGGDIKEPLEEIGVPAGLVDRDGVIRWQNHAATELFGDNTGVPFRSVVAPGENERVQARIAEIFRAGKSAEFSVRARRADGSVELREISSAPLRKGHSVVGIFGLSTAAHPGGAQVSGEPLTDLTARQRDVLRLLAEGKSTAQISEELHVSPVTVRNHIANLMATLGVHTRLQAVVAAWRAGLVGGSLSS